ncbi:MAG: methionine--tRNA ligase [Armatimonadetes bacterium]|nr:methionine--tRNA ligase [Armatimonadota bacterium]
MAKTTYITTPIYYVNSVPHVGHALTMLVCDVTKRYRQMRGEKVVFLTGTDENGLKVYEAAVAAGEDPMKFVDWISQAFRDVADLMHIDYDIFFRTTSEQHKVSVQALFERLRESGYIYSDKYEGWYDVSAETFVRESDLVDGKSPDGNEVRWVSEENYFFKLSAFGDKLMEHAAANPEFWLPVGRRAEVESFIKQGLRDICITRTQAGWGIPVPGDDSKVIYVWFDALINYLAATGWPKEGWEELWPAEIHWMAKEIYVRFHATLWPAMLMAAGLPLPKTVIAHGWFTFNDAKMSKSKGNVLAPAEVIQFFEENGCTHDLAVDATRFTLIRCFPYDNDSNYSMSEAERMYNSDLANDLGNALNRTLSMTHKFTEGKIPADALEPEVEEKIQAAKAAFAAEFVESKVHLVVDHALSMARELNRYVDACKPWDLAKNSDPRLGAVIKGMLAYVRAAEGMIRPFMPSTADRMAAQLGLDPTTHWDAIGSVDSLPAGTSIQQPEPMFPRLQVKPAEPKKAMENEPKPEAPVKAKKPAFEPPAEIGIEDFMKVQLKVARILEAEPLEGSEKLVKLQVMVGDEKRQILAGIKKSYNPVDLVGRQVVVVTNLKPAKLMGHESQGMVLAADGPNGTAILLQPEAEAPEGTSVH